MDGQIRNEFPTVVERVENLIEETQANLEFLGPQRQPSSNHREYFMEIATKTGPPDSWDLDVEDESEAKLNTRLCDIRNGFIDIVHSRGHTKDFRNAYGGVVESFSPYELEGADYLNLEHFNNTGNSAS
jgi:hypothetical protein